MTSKDLLYSTGNSTQCSVMIYMGKESACNAGDQGLIPMLGRPLEKGWLPTPVFLPGESHGQKSLVSYNPWGCKSWTRLK